MYIQYLSTFDNTCFRSTCTTIPNVFLGVIPETTRKFTKYHNFAAKLARDSVPDIKGVT